jgi:cytochrome b561
LLLALGAVVVLAVANAMQRRLALPLDNDPLEALQIWFYLGAVALAVGGCLIESTRRSGLLVLATALSFLLASSAALLQLLDANHGIAAPVCNALVSFALALVALHLALMRLAPPQVERFH